MIRKAEIWELPSVIKELMIAFEKASVFVRGNAKYTARQYVNLVESGTGVVFLRTNDKDEIEGALGGIKTPYLHSPKMIAIETFWFVYPDKRGHGLELLKAFEDWAKENGCQEIAMIHMADSYPEKLSKIYNRRGYKLAELHYVKEV